MGSITAITGPMFSGKSEELIRLANRFIIAKKNIAAFHHVSDNRFDTKKIVSRSGFEIESAPIESLYQVHEQLRNADVIIVDEAQFFKPGDLVDPAAYWRSQGKTILVSGLDMDVFGRPFGCMPQLLAIADKVTKLTAVCADCGEDAAISYRLSNESEQIVVGDKNYCALCWECYEDRMAAKLSPNKENVDG